MSKFCELVKDLCPNGVEYKNIKDICLENFWVMPATPKYQSTGIPYITSKNIRNGNVIFDDIKYITEEDYYSISNNRPIKENDFLISMIGTIGEVGIVKSDDLPFYGQNMYLLRLDTSIINIKFFYYYFISDKVKNVLMGEKNNGNQGYLKTKNIEEIRIPLPPMQIQNEIVHILDKYMELESELNEELSERKKQYEFWRRRLFAKDYYNEKYIYEVTTWDKKYNSVEKSMQPNIMKYKYLLASQLNEIIVSNGDVLILETGVNSTKKYTNEELAGDNLCSGEIVAIPWGGTPNVKYYNGRFVTGDNRIAISNDQSILNTKFLYYFLENRMDDISNFYRGSGIKHPEMKKVLTMKIPLPDISIQKNIVDTLDKFKDLEYELESELETRKEQFFYYKNKLLNFEELSVSE